MNKHSTAQHSTAQHSTAQHSTAQPLIYGKNEAVVFSGIAILLMYFLHFFSNPTHYSTIFGGLNIAGYSIERIIAVNAYICVSIYAFNTGYAIMNNPQGYTFSKIIKRIIIFLLSYWSICVLFLLYGYIANENFPDLNTFAYNLFGLKINTKEYICVEYSWYVLFYITILILSPLFLRIFSKSNFIYDIIIAAIITSAFFILDYITPSKYYIANTIFNDLTKCGSLVLTGIVVCKHKIFEAIDSRIGKQKNYIYILVITMTIIIRAANNTLEIIMPVLNFDIIILPILIFCTLGIFRNLRDKKIEHILYFFGTYSLNMWFLHGFFNLGTQHNLKSILYYPQYSLLVYLWAIFLILPTAMLCTKFQNAFLKYLK